MKHLIVFCIIVGLFIYFYKDGRDFSSDIKDLFGAVGEGVQDIFHK